MKKLSRFLALFMCLFCLTAALAACGGGDDTDDDGKIDYTVTLQRSSGDAIAGATVFVFEKDNRDKFVTYKTTDNNGTFTFNADRGEYDLEFGGVFPEGYRTSGYSVSSDAPTQTFKVPASLLTTPMSNTQEYKIGSVMHDFSWTDSEGNKSSLSEVFKTKKAVMLNFWYTTCTYCVAEFPAMQKIYNQYSNDIEVLGLNIYESNAKCEEFRLNLDNYYAWTEPLPFTMIGVAENPIVTQLANAFSLTGCPTSVIIDREGVVCFLTTGEGSEDDFTRIFSYYTAEPYVQKIYFPNSNQAEKPNIDAPAPADIAAAINSDGFDATYAFDDPTLDTHDEYNWPWLVCEDGKSIKTSNFEKDNSYAIIYMTVNATSSQAITFDYKTSCESDYDSFYVFANGVITFQSSGISDEWKTCYAYVPARANESVVIALAYMKDGGKNNGDDTIYVKNMRFVQTSDISERTEIIYRCATGTVTNDKYANYSTVVYNPDDNYYHVDTVDGPLLLANLMYATAWDSKSAWSYVMNGKLLYDTDNDGTNEDYTDRFTQFAQYSNSSYRPGFIAVTKELKQCLDALTGKYGKGHADEWLELCAYYVVYGGEPGEMIVDPIEGLSDYTAYETVLNTSADPDEPMLNHVNKRMIVVPRGIWFKFVPDTTAVYNIHSVGDIDSYAWLLDDEHNIIAENDDDPNFNSSVDATGSRNFSLVTLLESGKTYYILCDFANVDVRGEFDFVVDLVATSGDVWTAAAMGEYQAIIDDKGNVSEVSIKGAVDAVLGDDGNYHVGDKNGPLLYINLTSTTGLFTTDSVERMVKIKDDYVYCYYCKYCGTKYHTSVKDFEANDAPTCRMCLKSGKSFFEKRKQFELPTPLYGEDEVLTFYFTYDDNTVSDSIAMYQLNTQEPYTAANYVDYLSREDVDIVFTDYTQDIEKFIADSKDPAHYPQSADELINSDKAHPGCIVASAELVEILKKFIAFGSYAYSPTMDNAWLMMAYYYNHIG